MIVILIFIILMIIIVHKVRKQNYQLRYDSITFFEGCLGSGKTTIITRLAIKERRRRIINNFFAKPKTIILNILLFGLPIIHLIYIPWCLINKKIVKFERKGTEIYSNYPIWINKRVGYSIAINKELLNWLYKINENCIIVLDEVGYLFPNEMKKTDPLYQFCLTWFRHGTNCLMFCASQSLDECNIVFRRKVNRCYHLANMKRWIPFFSQVQITMSIISEDIHTITKDNIEERDSNWYKFLYPVKHFESRYGKKYYQQDNKSILELATSYQQTFNKMNIKNGERWKSLYYEFN